METKPKPNLYLVVSNQETKPEPVRRPPSRGCINWTTGLATTVASVIVPPAS